MLSVFAGSGIRATALPVYDFEALKLGRGNASCKECLPLLLTTGGLLEYLKRRTDPNEYLVYFMPTTPGNCRFTQYNVFLKSWCKRTGSRTLRFLSLTNENGYAGMAMAEVLNALKSTMVSDVMEDIKNALSVLARDKASAAKIFETQWEKIKVIFPRIAEGPL